MLALVTGASSGIGYEVSKELATRGYDIIGVSRSERDFAQLKEEFPNRKFKFISLDLVDLDNNKKLMELIKDEHIDFFFANAGKGTMGGFLESNVDQEMEMVKLNDLSNHYLIHEMLKKFVKVNKGKVLVTCSAAAFAPAPYMSAYYASKSYIYYLCLGYYRELKDLKSKVSISILCPGPVDTNFERVASVHFNIKPIKASKVAKIAVKKTLKNKTVIVPNFSIKMLRFFSNFLTKKQITRLDRKFQEKSKKID